MKTDNLPALTVRNGHATAMRGEGLGMSEFEQEANRSGLNMNDILFILFRHKWKILLCTTVGIVAAAAVYFVFPPIYESEAKLFVRYVVDKSAVDGLESQVKTPGAAQTDTLLSSEAEILTSADLALEVAEAIGVDRLMGGSGGKATNADAARTIVHGLKANAVLGTNIISVSYRDEDPKLPMPILQEFVNRYFDKHLEIHRSGGPFDFVARETEQLRAQLNKVEKDLKELKAKAGVISLPESIATLDAQLAKNQDEMNTAEADLAGQQARVKEIEKLLAGIDKNRSDTALNPPSTEAVREYRALVDRVAQLRQAENELLSKYTPQNRIVKTKQTQIAELENQRRSLEKKNPALIATLPSAGSPGSGRPDLVSERARLAAAESRIETLKAQKSDLQGRAKVLSEFGPQIGQLEREKDIVEASYRHSEASLEKARIDETLDPSRMPNISVVQKPSPAVRVTRDVKKLVMGLAGGGLAVGIAIALLIELVVDRTIKRSLELERRLRVPLLLSIPYLASNGRRLHLPDAGRDSETALQESASSDPAALENGYLLRPFCEAIRDRLGVFFELNNMAHKPKLVAVTGLSKNAGASTLAAGIAATFSETGDGKVLLVDKPVAPKRFYNMMEQFRASEFDYVIFDMPSLGDTSVTLPLATFMDTVLLVVEAEKSKQNAVKRAYAELAAKTKVSVVLNKTRSYGPKWLEGEL